MPEDKKKTQGGQRQNTFDNAPKFNANESIEKRDGQPKTHVTSRQPGTEGTTKKHNNN